MSFGLLFAGLFDDFRVHCRIDFELLVFHQTGFLSVLLVLALEWNRYPIDSLPVIHGGLALGWTVPSQREVSLLQNVPIRRIHKLADRGSRCVYVHDAGFNIPHLLRATRTEEDIRILPV